MRPNVWLKADCADNACVEVACVGRTPIPSEILVRDSKLGEASPVLRFTLSEWRAFIAGAKAGRFDIAQDSGADALAAAVAEAEEIHRREREAGNR